MKFLRIFSSFINGGPWLNNWWVSLHVNPWNGSCNADTYDEIHLARRPSYQQLFAEFLVEGVWEELREAGEALDHVQSEAAVVSEHEQ